MTQPLHRTLWARIRISVVTGLLVLASRITDDLERTGSCWR